MNNKRPRKKLLGLLSKSLDGIGLRQIIQGGVAVVPYAVPFSTTFNPNVATGTACEGIASVGHITPVFDVFDAHAIVVAGTEHIVGKGKFGFAADVEAATLWPTVAKAAVLEVAVIIT